MLIYLVTETKGYPAEQEQSFNILVHKLVGLGNLAFGDDMAGVAVMRAMTDSGIEVIFAKQGNVKTGKSTYRFTTFYGVTNLNPEMNGILIGGQTF